MFVNYIKSRCKPRPRHTYIQNLPLKQNKKNKLLKELTFLGLKLAKTENKSCTQKKLNLNLQQHYFGPKSNLRLCFLNVTGNSVHAVYVPVTSKFIQIVLQYNGPYKLVFFFFLLKPAADIWDSSRTTAFSPMHRSRLWCHIIYNQDWNCMTALSHGKYFLFSQIHFCDYLQFKILFFFKPLKQYFK